MTEQEAQALVRSIEGTWRTDFGNDGRRVWRDRLLRYDHELAERAIKILADQQRYPPAVFDLRETIRKLEADARANTPALPEPPKQGTPDWVFVWRWARTGREPPVAAPFPQQHPHGNAPPEALTLAEYGQLRDEWIAAGRPGLNETASKTLA